MPQKVDVIDDQIGLKVWVRSCFGPETMSVSLLMPTFGIVFQSY